MTLQTLPDDGDEPLTTRVGNVAGFSLHAGVATRAHERDKLERLCCYITRPAVATKRLSMTRNGQVRYQLKTPWRNGTTHVVFEPLDFMFRTNGMPRAQEAHDCREAGGRVTQEQLPRSGYLQAGFTCSQTQSQPDPLSWCVRTE
jgi:hypothetical protein